MVGSVKIKQLLILTLALLGAIGCGKKCQVPPTTAFTSLTDTPWRLVQTTDPQIVNTLDNFNFRIMTFAATFTGTENQVTDNQEYDNPLLTFQWVPNSTSNMVRIKYTQPAATPTGTTPPTTPTGTTTTTGTDAGTYDYSYSLSTQLEMTESQRGYYYRFVPFTGVVNPDNNCTF